MLHLKDISQVERTLNQSYRLMLFGCTRSLRRFNRVGSFVIP